MVSETKGDWLGLVLNIACGAIAVLVVASLFFMFYTRRITKPIEQLTEAAEQVEKRNYDFVLTYDKDDELGLLTRSFRHLSDNVKAHISDLNEQVYVDSLTHVKNKGAISKDIEELQEQIDHGTVKPEFAVIAFDCDNLKGINDQYGHDKGDIYLKTACRTISDVFKHSPVFRVGGDEFTVILRNEDYLNMTSLLEQFDKSADDINASVCEPWEHVYPSSLYSRTISKFWKSAGLCNCR